MAPIRPSKRPRAQTDEYGSVLGSVTPGPSRNKRVRITPEAQSDYESSRESSAIPVANGNAAAGNDVFQNDDDEVPEATAQESAMILRQLEQGKYRQNTPAENGIVEEIRCTNFMCHEQLTVTLGPLINFIVGHNGSGKSAVLTALTLCLGGKPTATNRGQSLKSFIKEGRDYCKLEVKLKNHGSSAFKPDVYGRSIIVERHFNKAGASGFKVKDQNGKVVQTRKQEVEDIIDAFALQMDNPMNVLTQDMARQFLNDSNARDKYKFFLKGTQLETLNHDYNIMTDSLDEMEQKLRRKKDDLMIYKKAAAEAEERANKARNLHKLRDRLRNLHHMAAWASVKEHEEILENCDTEVQEAAEEIRRRKEHLDTVSDRYDVANQAAVDAEAEAEESADQLQPARQIVEELDAQFRDATANLKKVFNTQREIKGKVNLKTQAVQKYEAEIKDHQQRQADADGGYFTQKQSELQEAETKRDAAQQEENDHLKTKADLVERKNQAGIYRQRAGAEVETKSTEVQQSENRMRQLQGNQRDWTTAYPNTLPKVLKAIDTERRFSEKPIGPMGRHVTILKPQWTSILEKQFGSTLNSFVVTCVEDERILRGILRQCHYPASVFTMSERTPLDTRPNEPDESMLTWMRALKIDNPLVLNCMIMQQNIEQVVLITERQKAWDFMRSSDASQRRNVKACFAMSDQSNKRGHRITATASGSLSMEPISDWQGQVRMNADREEQRRFESANLQSLRSEFSALRAKVEQAQIDLDGCKAALETFERKSRQLKIKRQRAEDDVARLEGELSDATPNAGMVASLQEALAAAKAELSFEEQQFQDTVLERDELGKENAAHKRNLEEAQRRVRQLEEEEHSALRKAARMKGKRETALNEKNEAHEAVSEAENEKVELEEKRQHAADDVERLTGEARSVCERDAVTVPADKTYQDLMKSARRVAQDLETSAQELGGSEEDLLQLAVQEKQRLVTANQAYMTTKRTVDILKRSLVDRRNRWSKFRKAISTRARVVFGYLLSERKFRGELEIDHSKQALDLKIEPDITKVSAAGRQTKTLSGGEKSFSTICLLLALWEAMGSPIRCLDEFDVFMDSVNRSISMKLMIEAARRSTSRQFILITPQSMDSHQTDDVKVIKMNDPERGQTALNFRR